MYETGMSARGVHEDCSVVQASGPSLLTVWNGERLVK